MKNILLIVFFVLIASFAKSQVMPGKLEWLTIKSSNLKCWTCKEYLEKYLTSENESTLDHAIIQRRYNLIAGEIRIQYYPDRAKPDDIRTVLNNAGFDADSTKAEPDAYKKVPPICKRAEDGGGPQKGKPCHLQPFN